VLISPLHIGAEEMPRHGVQPNKKPALAGFLFAQRNRAELLQLGFLVYDMLACLGIVFLHFDLLRCGALVPGRGVEMTGTGT